FLQTRFLILLVFTECHNCLRRNVVPPLSLANRNYLGPVPPELEDLTFIEEAMIALCRAKSCIVQLSDVSGNGLPNKQRGMKGNIIIYPQHPERLATVLPPTIDEVVAPICVIFVGSSPPTAEWLLKKAKPLTVRRDKIRAALLWLKQHNPLYHSFTIDEARIATLPEHGVLPFHIQTTSVSSAQEAATSRYDNPHPSDAQSSTATSLEPEVAAPENSDQALSSDEETPFHNVAVCDVDGHESPAMLRSAALRHVKNGGAYVELPHDSDAVNEFNNPSLFPSIYPTLFPYGTGGFEDTLRVSALSFKRH
ncbi:hypothetical protein EIP91_011575, partial [Steccherinum ochraceum]